MATPISKFGQYVLLKVHDSAGGLVFSTDSLRVDFEVFNISGFSRSKVEIYNLDAETIREISNGECYVSVDTRLHDGVINRVIDGHYLSNALDVIKVPNNITSLYCYSGIQKKFLEKQIDVVVKRPTLRKVIQEITKTTGFNGSLQFKHFPSDVLDYAPPRHSSRQRGSLSQCIKRLSEEHGFNIYTEGTGLVCMYIPNHKNVADTDLHSSDGDIVLDSNNMRQNPKIGPAQLFVVSNLDPNIKPTTVLNISNLLTVDTASKETTLQVASDFLKGHVAGFAKYQTLTVKHVGSNYTSSWATTAMASSPTPGTNMATGQGWWTK